MKKMLLIALVAVAGVRRERKIRASQQEQALWAEATDSVRSHLTSLAEPAPGAMAQLGSAPALQAGG